MDQVPTPKDMRGAAGVAVTLAYTAGLAGVIAGGVLFQRGESTLGVVVIVITFAVGAGLMIASYLVRGLAAVLAHVAALESDVRVLLGDRYPRPDPRLDRDHDPGADHHPWP